MDRLPTSVAPLALQAGAEPLPGYRLLEPLGKGGFREVWKCEVSGGLQKAIKFVRDSSAGAGGFRSAMTQELQAIQWIKGIRHPFLLSIERIEVVSGTLVLVMELADQNLLNLYTSFTKQKLPGIPRPLLLALLREVAEVLDLMNFQYGLQHLDIKPHNIFLVGAHAKVGDFGLVAGLPGHVDAAMAVGHTGVTPLYAAPERVRGTVSRSTDQYSLAIVYQQMLTSLTPYRAVTPQQLTQLHLTGTPDLASLSVEDRPVVAQALSRNPEERFPTCSAFVEALIRGEHLASPAVLLIPSAGSGEMEQARRSVVQTVVPGGRTPTPDATRMVALDVAVSAPLEFLPGYKLVECLEQTALGDVWKVVAPDGRERLAHWLLHPLDPSEELIARLEQLQHPALISSEIQVSPTRRLVLLTDLPNETLRDRLETCRASGLPGIPRDALLSLLFPIGESLDWLATEPGLPHLGVTPGGIVLEGDWPRLRDAGLIPLVWLDQQKAAAILNVRYGAPETAEPGAGSSASDQYSLALIYAEMVTGVHPRREVRGRGPVRLNLDLLSTKDRAVVARALEEDPAARFPSCLSFLEALVTAAQDSLSLGDFPPVVPVGVLNGTSTLGNEPLPELAPLIESILARVTGAGKFRQAGDTVYRELPNGTWECCYPIHVVPGVLALKLEGFRQQWGARPIRTPNPDTFTMQLIVKLPRTSLFQFRNPEGGLEIVIRLLPPGLASSRSREALIRIRAVGENLAAAQHLMETQGPELIQSLRTYLHPAPELRTEPRWPFPYHLKLWVEPPPDAGGGWMVGEALGMDLSRGGLRFALADPLDLDLVYVEFPEWEELDGLAVRARVRRRVVGEGCYEYGAAFE